MSLQADLVTLDTANYLAHLDRIESRTEALDSAVADELTPGQAFYPLRSEEAVYDALSTTDEGTEIADVLAEEEPSESCLLVRVETGTDPIAVRARQLAYAYWEVRARETLERRVEFGGWV